MITLSIPDMSCGHCRASIEAALAPVPGITALRFDGERRQAEVEGDHDRRHGAGCLHRFGTASRARSRVAGLREIRLDDVRQRGFVLDDENHRCRSIRFAPHGSSLVSVPGHRASTEVQADYLDQILRNSR